jgi:hypothetical protein
VPRKHAPLQVINSVSALIPPDMQAFLDAREAEARAASQGLLGANGMGKQKLEISKIRLDGGTQPRASTVAEAVYEYADDMKAGDQFPAIKVFFDGEDYWLADGFHRVKAALENKYTEINADIMAGTLRDAKLYAFTQANRKQGMRHTREDKRYAAKLLLLDEEWGKWGDREIARRVGLSPSTVGLIRKESTVQIGQLKQRQYTRNGKTQVMNTSEIGSKPAESMTWQEYYFSKEIPEGTRATFMQLASTPSVWIAAGDEASFVALILGVETTFLEDQGQDMLKLVGMSEPQHLEWLEKWLEGPVESYLEGDTELVAAAVQLPPVYLSRPDRGVIAGVKPAAVQQSQTVAPVSKPAAEPRWNLLGDVWRRIKDEHPNEVIAFAVPKHSGDLLFVCDDAIQIAKVLGVKTMNPSLEGLPNFVLRLRYPWCKEATDLLTKQGIEVYLAAAPESHRSQITLLANRFRSAWPTHRVCRSASPASSVTPQQLNSLVEHPLDDPAAAAMSSTQFPSPDLDRIDLGRAMEMVIAAMPGLGFKSETARTVLNYLVETESPEAVYGFCDLFVKFKRLYREQAALIGEQLPAEPAVRTARAAVAAPANGNGAAAAPVLAPAPARPAAPVKERNLNDWYLLLDEHFGAKYNIKGASSFDASHLITRWMETPDEKSFSVQYMIEGGKKPEYIRFDVRNKALKTRASWIVILLPQQGQLLKIKVQKLAEYIEQFQSFVKFQEVDSRQVVSIDIDELIRRADVEEIAL